MNYGSSTWRSFFWHLPPLFRDIATSIYGLRQTKRVFGKQYKEYYKFLERSQFFSQEELASYQLSEVVRLIQYASENVPFYKKLFKELNLSIRNIKTIKDIIRIPVIDKETVRLYSGEFISNRYTKRQVVSVHTSGTTGKGLQLVLSKEAWQREYAFRYLHLAWAGVYPGMRMAFIGGHPVSPPDKWTPPFWNHDYYNNSIYFSSQHISTKTLPLYIDRLRSFKPDLIRGYPSSVYMLALGALEYSRNEIRPKAVFTNSESLLDYQRHAIESAFGCKVFNWYGNAEQVGNIVECEKGSLHVKMEHSLIEILKPDATPAKPGETGEMVCTGFGNYAMPLIRYRIGDLAVPSDKQCDCGRKGQIVDQIVGRLEDIIVTPDGRHVGRLDHLFKEMIHVKEAQILQEDISSITIKIVKRPGFGDADLKLLKEEAVLRLGTSIYINFEFAEEIKKEPSGKLRFVISRVPPQIKTMQQENNLREN